MAIFIGKQWFRDNLSPYLKHIKGLVLRVKPADDIAALTARDALEYQITEVDGSEYVFVPTAKVTSDQLNNVANIPDDAGTGRWIKQEVSVDKVTSTDHAIARFDGTDGQIQDSFVKIDDTGNIKAESTAPKTMSLTLIGNANSPYTNAYTRLISQTGSGARGMGMFSYDTLGDIEWFSGNPYTGSDSWVVTRQTGTGSHHNSTATKSNYLLALSAQGDLTVKGNLECIEHCRVKYVDDTHYGYVGLYNNSGNRALYLGYGDGQTYANLALDHATELKLSGGKFNFKSGVAMTGIGHKEGYVPTSDADGNLTMKSPLGGAGERGTIVNNGMYYASAVYITGQYVHIKLPITIANDNAMYMHMLKGYQYQDSVDIDITFTGYCYKNGNALIYDVVHDRTSPSSATESVTQYAGHDGHIYAAIQLAVNSSYLTYNSSSMRVGNGGLMGAFEYTMSAFPQLTTGTFDNISRGDRSAHVTMTSSPGLFKASYDDPAKLVNGSRSNDTYFDGVGDSTGLWLKASFNAVSKTIKGFILAGSNNTPHGAVVCEVSDDDASWTQVHSGDLETSKYVLCDTPTAGTFFRIKWVGNTANTSPWLYELEFEVQ
jgi:hypothetical protein